MGYGDTTKGNRQRVFRSRDVTFNEGTQREQNNSDSEEGEIQKKVEIDLDTSGEEDVKYHEVKATGLVLGASETRAGTIWRVGSYM